MSEQALRALSTEGLKNAPHLRDLSQWCWDRAEQTGDARYCALARLLGRVAEEWDEIGGVEDSIAREIQNELANHLASVLDTPDPVEASSIAKLLREQVAEIVSRWQP